LGIIYHRFKETGQRQNLIISKKYADVVEACSYINPVIFEGNHGDLKEAIRFGKQRFDSVTTLQCHCRDFQIQHRTPSFQLDQWLRAGCVEQFGKLPLVFDNRSQLQERILRDNTVKRGEKFILIADHSESSPFDKIDELVEMVTKEFGETYKIIKLSEIKAVNFIHVLGLYDKASALVSIETAHTHLSLASKVPVFVLAADDWRGSAYQERFKFYCRYSQWDEQKVRLLTSMFNAINGVEQIKVTPLKTAFPNGYNPAIIKWQGKILTSYRYHPDNTWRTRLAVDDKSLIMPESLNGFSIEDARFFVTKGKLHASYTISSSPNNVFYSTVGYGDLVQESNGWKVLTDTQPQVPALTHGGNKNFVFFEADSKLYFIYGIKDKSQIVYEVNKERVGVEIKSPEPKWNWGQIHGDFLLPYKGGFLRFFHSRVDYSKTTFRYFIGAALMDSKPPFTTTAISSDPILQGNELYTHNLKYWYPNVSIAYGAIQEGDKFILSVGRNHSHCELVELTEQNLKL
jgi:predicted GH43/DUF377 family glycosyl hydrolase